MSTLRLRIRCGLGLPLLLVLWSIAGNGAGVSVYAAEALDIEEVLANMASKGRNFDAEPLKKEGVAGLSRLLDKLLPQPTKQAEGALTKDEVAQLIRQLGAEDFEVRQAATEKLTEEARPFQTLLEQAAEDEDPEVRARAKSILKTWSAQAKATQEFDFSQYDPALRVYLEGMSDEAMLTLLAERTRVALEREPKPKGQIALLSQCIDPLVKSGEDQYTDLFIPLLKHDDEKLAAWLTRTAGSRSGNRHFPRLLLHALQSDRDLVVDAALSWAPNCWDIHKASEVKRLSIIIFNGDKEELKFKACFPLMHDYHDKNAMAYLLSQANSKDERRAARAISWIGDASNFSRPASPELLETLLPMLKSEDKVLRCRVADTLGTYTGTEVVDALISLLDDPEVNVQQKASVELLRHADPGMAITRLTHAAKNGESETIRAKAKELLIELPKKRFPPRRR